MNPMQIRVSQSEGVSFENESLKCRKSFLFENSLSIRMKNNISIILFNSRMHLPFKKKKKGWGEGMQFTHPKTAFPKQSNLTVTLSSLLSEALGAQ